MIVKSSPKSIFEMTNLRNVYPAANILGESAIWHAASKRLLWIDLYVPRLFIHDPVSEKTEVHEIKLRAPLGAIVATTDPDFLMITHADGISSLHIISGKTKLFAHPEAGRDAVNYNDCKVDRWGRLWAGTSHVKEKETRGALWCVLSDGTCYLGDVGFAISNGPAFSLDGKVMYFNDSLGRQTFAYDIAADDPYPRNRRVLVSYDAEEGLPDGLTVDSDDNLWVAHWGGSRITRISPKGVRLETVSIPAPHVTTVGFGGLDLGTLYVTTARDGLSENQIHNFPQSGDLFSLRPNANGVAEVLFPYDN